MTSKISVKRVVDAPPERTWQAWTIADELEQWFSARERITIIEFDLKPGGKVRLKSPDSAGEYTWTYIKVDKPNELVFDILDFSLPQYPDGIGGVCHIDFKAVGDKTEITLWGELPDESLRDTYEKAIKGWNGTFDTLNRFLNKEV